nr:dihydroflavonol 4-reductase [Ziziphora clinopodioides subsp. bungeana]
MGYSVNTTVRISPDGKRDLTYLTTLPNASENLTIFEADLDQPDSFAPAIKGCSGVFHVVHPMEWDETEPEETKTKKVIDGLLGILKACIESTTVKRFMHTSTASAVVFDGKDSETSRDEDSWTDINFIRNLGLKGNSYAVTKTLAEKTALEFGQEHGLDVISLLPTWVHGPFFIPRCPNSVLVFLALILGDENYYKFLVKTSLVHVEDVARAFVHLFEFPKAEGRYICSAVEVTIEELSEFLSRRYPQFHIPTTDSLKGIEPVKICGLSSKKLLETGFKYEYGMEGDVRWGDS